MSGEAECFACVGEKSCRAWLTYLACVSGPVSNQRWFSTGRCGRRQCWFPSNVVADPSHFSYCSLTSVTCLILETSQLISPAWLGPVVRVTCPWAHLAQMAQVQVEGNSPISACTVLCERQPACHGPLGSSAKEVPGLSSAGST